MIKEGQTKKIIIGIGSVLVASWGIYSVFFQRFYQEVVFFTTDDAPSLIQLLELIGYRGKELLPYLTVFFTLTTLSLLFAIYLNFAIKEKRMAVGIIWFLFAMLIGYNIINKLAALLVVLIIVAALLMYSLVVTINYLYVDKTTYEAGDVLHTEGPFETEEKARVYSKGIVTKRKDEFLNGDFLLASDIYMDEPENYYVDIYLAAIDEM